MNQCINCRRCVTLQTELTTGGRRLVWKRECGYCTANEIIRYPDKTEPDCEYLVQYGNSTVTY